MRTTTSGANGSRFTGFVYTVVAGAMDVRRAVTSIPSHMTSGPTSAELHPVYPSPHAANPSAAATGIPVSEPQTAFRPVGKRSAIVIHINNGAY